MVNDKYWLMAIRRQVTADDEDLFLHLLHHDIAMPDAPESSDVCQYGDENHATCKPPHVAGDTREHGCDGSNDHTLRTLHQSYLALDVQSLGTSTYIAHHHRTNHGSEGDNAHPEPFALMIHADEGETDTEEAHQFAVSVECAVPKCSEEAALAAHASQAAVHHQRV